MVIMSRKNLLNIHKEKLPLDAQEWKTSCVLIISPGDAFCTNQYSMAFTGDKTVGNTATIVNLTHMVFNLLDPFHDNNSVE